MTLEKFTISLNYNICITELGVKYFTDHLRRAAATLKEVKIKTLRCNIAESGSTLILSELMFFNELRSLSFDLVRTSQQPLPFYLNSCLANLQSLREVPELKLNFHYCKKKGWVQSDY